MKYCKCIDRAGSRPRKFKTIEQFGGSGVQALLKNQSIIFPINLMDNSKSQVSSEEFIIEAQLRQIMKMRPQVVGIRRKVKRFDSIQKALRQVGSANYVDLYK